MGGGAEGVEEEAPKEKEPGVVDGVVWPEGAPKLNEGAEGTGAGEAPVAELPKENVEAAGAGAA